MVCPECESEKVETVPYTHKFNYGFGPAAIELSIELPLRHCSWCGFEWLDAEGNAIQQKAVDNLIEGQKQVGEILNR